MLRPDKHNNNTAMIAEPFIACFASWHGKMDVGTRAKNDLIKSRKNDLAIFWNGKLNLLVKITRQVKTRGRRIIECPQNGFFHGVLTIILTSTMADSEVVDHDYDQEQPITLKRPFFLSKEIIYSFVQHEIIELGCFIKLCLSKITY